MGRLFGHDSQTPVSGHTSKMYKSDFDWYREHREALNMDRNKNTQHAKHFLVYSETISHKHSTAAHTCGAPFYSWDCVIDNVIVERWVVLDAFVWFNFDGCDWRIDLSKCLSFYLSFICVYSYLYLIAFRELVWIGILFSVEQNIYLMEFGFQMQFNQMLNS